MTSTLENLSVTTYVFIHANPQKYPVGCMTAFLGKLYPIMKREPSVFVFLYQVSERENGKVVKWSRQFVLCLSRLALVP
jgi:hypothetical protein